MTPEEKARLEIDDQLQGCGWDVQDKEHVNLSAGMITANFRADGGPVKSTVKGQRVDTGRQKLGAVLGEGSFVGVGAMLMPGVKIGEGSIVGPLTLVLEDVPDHTRYYAQQTIVRKPISRDEQR